MNVIQQITQDALQHHNFILPDGTAVSMIFRFVPLQQGWFIQDLTYGSFELTNIRITNSPNMLHQFRNQIPFGLACFSTGSREPSLQQDFSSQASILYLLTKAEVNAYAEFLSGGQI